MKHIKHEKRKSFAKWAMPGQRAMTSDMEELEFRRDVAVMKMKPITNIGKNNGPLKHSHAQPVGKPAAFVAMIKSYNGMLPRNVGRSNGGARVASKGKVIPSTVYADYLNRI